MNVLTVSRVTLEGNSEEENEEEEEEECSPCPECTECPVCSTEPTGPTCPADPTDVVVNTCLYYNVGNEGDCRGCADLEQMACEMDADCEWRNGYCLYFD